MKSRRPCFHIRILAAFIIVNPRLPSLHLIEVYPSLKIWITPNSTLQNRFIRRDASYLYTHFKIYLESVRQGNSILESLFATPIVRFDNLLNILLKKMQETYKLNKKSH